MSLKKQYLKSKDICKVTFRITKKLAKDAKKVSVVGDFNDWDPKGAPMQSLKNGDFKTTISLHPGNEYQFKYLINNRIWENEPQADKYVYSSFGACDNSVVVV